MRVCVCVCLPLSVFLGRHTRDIQYTCQFHTSQLQFLWYYILFFPTYCAENIKCVSLLLLPFVAWFFCWTHEKIQYSILPAFPPQTTSSWWFIYSIWQVPIWQHANCWQPRVQRNSIQTNSQSVPRLCLCLKHISPVKISFGGKLVSGGSVDIWSLVLPRPQRHPPQFFLFSKLEWFES